MRDLVERIDRLESTLAIQQLPVRYARALDGRDVDAWLALFVEDVDCGRRGKGREVLRAFIEPMMASFYRSVHLICGQQIDFVDADHATGSTYCRAEHEDGDRWVIMAIVYFDTYERRGGSWYFVRRNEQHWYAADALSRPSGPNFSDWPGQAIAEPGLPAGFPAWRAFWERMGLPQAKRRSLFPIE